MPIWASALHEAETQYVGRNPKSFVQHREATLAMPGGNTRSVLHIAPFPAHHGARARAPICGIWTAIATLIFSANTPPALFGHSHPGDPRPRSIGRSTAASASAPRTCSRRASPRPSSRVFPSIELVRFTKLGHRGQSAGAVHRARGHRPRQDAGVPGRLSRRRVLFPRGDRAGSTRRSISCSRPTTTSRPAWR
ncbi:MAG: hypothetical protein WDO24_25055 [Pseudomonadota bacterium]